jgi:hypothetical protein
MKTKPLFSDIVVKVNELLEVSKPDLIGDKDFLKKFDAKYKRQNELIEELIPMARKFNTLLGRTVRFPMADSYALYLVTKVNTKTVELTWLDYMDAWVDDRIGYKGNIDRWYVQRQKDFDDKWSDMAEAKRKEVQAKLIAQG